MRRSGDDGQDAGGEAALIILDLRNLEFLNSSGINCWQSSPSMSQESGHRPRSPRLNRIPWQGKSLQNPEKLHSA